jgi:uncharacterized protein YdbL (DUF1318 family)
MSHSRFIAIAVASLVAGCVAPNVVVVDQKTALEQQAAGGYPALENDLERAGLVPTPEPFAREELAGGRERAGASALSKLAESYAEGVSDADTIDRLLLQKCIGEALSGLLVPRPGDCIGTTDTAELTRVLGRENLHRRQLWQLLASERHTSIEAVRDVWQELHLAQVVCGGLIETRGGSWVPKTC